MAGGAETRNIAALPAIARLGTCESARGPDADGHVKLLIQFAVEGSLSGAYSQSRNSFSGMPKTREQNASGDVLVPRSHRPPFTTAPVADSQRSSDPLLFITSARADSQRRWLPPSIFR